MKKCHITSGRVFFDSHCNMSKIARL